MLQFIPYTNGGLSRAAFARSCPLLLSPGERGFLKAKLSLPGLGTPRKNHPKGLFGGRDDEISRLEAILFLSRQAQTSRKLAQLAGLADGTKARTLVRTLNRGYDAAGSSFRVEEVAGGFQLLTRPKFAPWLRRLHSGVTEVLLSAPALETLAIVAYRQPVLRADIEAIRGVQSGEVLRQLIERDLVRIAGRSKELGRPFLYATTRQFLQVFGLRHLEELPRAEELRTRGPAVSCRQEIHVASEPHTSTSNQPQKAHVAEEEGTVKTHSAAPHMLNTCHRHAGDIKKCREGLLSDDILDRYEDEEQEELDDEDDDFDDFDDEEEDEEDDEEEDLDDEPWEEVDEEDEDEEDEDWEDEDDEDWEDEDWEEDDDEDWDEDEEEEEEEEE